MRPRGEGLTPMTSPNHRPKEGYFPKIEIQTNSLDEKKSSHPFDFLRNREKKIVDESLAMHDKLERLTTKIADLKKKITLIKLMSEILAVSEKREYQESPTCREWVNGWVVPHIGPQREELVANTNRQQIEIGENSAQLRIEAAKLGDHLEQYYQDYYDLQERASFQKMRESFGKWLLEANTVLSPPLDEYQIKKLNMRYNEWLLNEVYSAIKGGDSLKNYETKLEIVVNNLKPLLSDLEPDLEVPQIERIHERLNQIYNHLKIIEETKNLSENSEFGPVGEPLQDGFRIRSKQEEKHFDIMAGLPPAEALRQLYGNCEQLPHPIKMEAPLKENYRNNKIDYRIEKSNTQCYNLIANHVDNMQKALSEIFQRVRLDLSGTPYVDKLSEYFGDLGLLSPLPDDSMSLDHQITQLYQSSENRCDALEKCQPFVRKLQFLTWASENSFAICQGALQYRLLAILDKQFSAVQQENKRKTCAEFLREIIGNYQLIKEFSPLEQDIMQLYLSDDTKQQEFSPLEQDIMQLYLSDDAKQKVISKPEDLAELVQLAQALASKDKGYRRLCKDFQQNLSHLRDHLNSGFPWKYNDIMQKHFVGSLQSDRKMLLKGNPEAIGKFMEKLYEQFLEVSPFSLNPDQGRLLQSDPEAVVAYMEQLYGLFLDVREKLEAIGQKHIGNNDRHRSRSLRER